MYIVVSGLMPSRMASVRTKVLNDEPACRRPCAARLNWLFFFPGISAVIARIAPFFGLIETSAEAGSVFRFSVLCMAWVASFWNFGTIVV
jgi:hypothetical protein